ncbi:hypothetical protein CAMRE0001_0130 [Campylobacter rectus RM3267]|uniref:Uncharacterized protein n=1 Tax=Campylobacter rectus RM3267 TaxID=553218 RepID=B9CXU1_CAMRE|nr:hypothetical protein CAMRE0001_0130 [Campylobacter rectus RM3267]
MKFSQVFTAASNLSVHKDFSVIKVQVSSQIRQICRQI